jgi:hypothetical protein
MNKPMKLDSDMLLALLLKQNKMTHSQWESIVRKKYNLDKATFVSEQEVQHTKINPTNQQPLFSQEQIWDTGYHLVKTTQYGRVKDILDKQRSVTSPPKVIIKKQRKILRVSK